MHERKLIQIENEANYYTFHISPTSTGNASTSSDSLFYNNGVKFSTIDVKHDNLGGGYNCSGTYELGFYYLSIVENN